MIFQQPNFFGCLEPAPELAAAANEAGALPVAHVDPLSLGVLEAPGRYGCALAIGEGQAAGNFPSYGGPHYGFLAARRDFIRRMPGRIVGETVDAAGERGYVLTLQTREQHIRREKATSNITTNQTLLALGGLVYLDLARAAGAARAGGDLPLARRVREGAARGARRARAAVSRSGNVQGVCRPRRTERARGGRAARERGVHPGYALGRDYAGMDDVLLVAVTEKRTPGGDRPARRGARGGDAMKLIYEKSQAGPPRLGDPAPRRPAGARGARRAAPGRAAAPARGAGVRADPPLHRALDAQLRRRHRLLPARLLHDEVQPADQRAPRRRCPGSRNLHPLQEEDGAQGALELSGACRRSSPR